MIKHPACVGMTISAALALMITHAHAAPPILIEFAPGAYGAVVHGHVTMSAPQQTFKLDVKAGQCGGSEVRIILAANSSCGFLNQSHTRSIRC